MAATKTCTSSSPPPQTTKPNHHADSGTVTLAGYRGYLQADAYGGYDGIFARGSVTEVACWAHARRKFYEAQDSDGQRAAEMLALIGELYAIEREAQARSTRRRAQRCAKQRSVPVLARIKTWLDAEARSRVAAQPAGHRRSPTRRTSGRRSTTYTTQGFLNIDNNASERALKRVAIGRKNWLFAGHDAAAAEPRPAVVPDRQRRTPRRRPAALSHQRPGQDRRHAAATNSSSSCPTPGNAPTRRNQPQTPPPPKPNPRTPHCGRRNGHDLHVAKFPIIARLALRLAEVSSACTISASPRRRLSPATSSTCPPTNSMLIAPSHRDAFVTTAGTNAGAGGGRLELAAAATWPSALQSVCARATWPSRAGRSSAAKRGTPTPRALLPTKLPHRKPARHMPCKHVVPPPLLRQVPPSIRHPPPPRLALAIA